MASSQFVAMIRTLSFHASPCHRTETTLLAAATLLLLLAQLTSSQEDCPAFVTSNYSNCECHVMSTIVCNNLDALPDFENDDATYNALLISRQDIRTLPEGAFHRIQVKKIVLNFNPIGRSINVHAFSGVNWVLEDLQLGACQIQELPPGLLNDMSRLHTLHLWGNKLKEIPSRFFHGGHRDSSLQVLHLWGNQIQSVDRNTFAGLRRLKKLDLDRNEITEISKDVFRHLERLETLHLGQNKLHTLTEETFSHMLHLKVLNLDGNVIRFIFPQVFNGLQSLVSLGLQNNQLDNFMPETTFRGLKNLTILWLQNNNMYLLWPQSFKGLRGLQTLSLAGNRLKQVPGGLLDGNSRLKHLYLGWNDLTTLNKCILDTKVKLKTLSLLGNPLDCNCDLAWTMELAERGTDVYGTCSITASNHSISSVANRINYEMLSCNPKKLSSVCAHDSN